MGRTMRLLLQERFAAIFAPLQGRRIGYVPTCGTLDDRLIEMAAFQLFSEFGIDYRIEPLAGDGDIDELVVAGGGPADLCPAERMDSLLKVAATKPLTILPRSFLLPWLDEHDTPRCHRVYLRERASLACRPGGILMPDLLLGLDVDAAPSPENLIGVWLRQDREALFARHGSGDPTTVCQTPDDYLALAGRYRHLVTDRASFAIAGLIHGRDVTLMPSRSPTNRSLWETWLKDLGCKWLESWDPILTLDNPTPAYASPRADSIRADTPSVLTGDASHSVQQYFDRDAQVVALTMTLARRDREAAELRGLLLQEQRSMRRVLEQIGDRLTVCEERHTATLDALSATQQRLENRADETQAAIHDLHAAIEPLQLAGAGQPAPELIEKRAQYRKLVARIRTNVRDHVPRDARVLVISRGDEELLRLFGRQAGHFPRDEAGTFAGHYPADGVAAVSQLRALVSQGWEYLVIPATSFWWLEHYNALRVYLERSCAALFRDETGCMIFSLVQRGLWYELAEFVAAFKRSERRFPAILDWETGSHLARVFQECAVFSPIDPGLITLPYVDESIDVVAVPRGDAVRHLEAERVAAAAVIELENTGNGFCVTIERLGRHRADGEAARRAAGFSRAVITPAVRRESDDTPPLTQGP